MAMIERINQVKDFIFAVALIIGLVAGSAWTVAEVWFSFEAHSIKIAQLEVDLEYLGGRVDRKISNHEDEFHKRDQQK